MSRYLVLNNIEKEKLGQLAKKSETAGTLTPQLLQVVFKEKWFKLFVPKELGGLDLNLPEALQVEETLAKIDGSLGWTVTLCAGANLFVGFIEKKKAARIFSKAKICFGGSGAASGVAQKVRNGYIVNGNWKYATGTPHLTHFTANCIIEENGKPILKQDGTPLIQSFFFNKKDVTVREDWNTMGLKATAGHSFSVSNLFVGIEHSFVIDAANTTFDNPIFKYPFMSLAETTLAVNTLGMTKHFLEEALGIIQKRKTLSQLNDTKYLLPEKEIQAAQQKTEELSGKFYELASHSWKELIDNKAVSKKTQQKISTLCRKLVKECRRNVAELYPYCGLSTTNQDAEINRIFRDIFTGSQHGLLQFNP